MKKVILAAALLLFSTPAFAQAGHFELTLGYQYGTPTATGTWWQAPLPHHLNTETWNVTIAYIHPMYFKHLDWTIGYHRNGMDSFSAEITPDPFYDVANNTVTTPLGVSHWTGRGYNQGIYLALRPHITMDGVNVFAEAGVDFYQGTFDLYVPDIWTSMTCPDAPRTSLHYRHVPRVQVGYHLAVGLTHKGLGWKFTMEDELLSGQVQTNPGTAKICFPSIVNGATYTLAAVVDF